jgi:uncharacterized membrane protein YuzA (DUF378 family)
MDYIKIILMLAQILVIAGALNWGLVAYNGTDLVQQLTGGGDIEKYVKFAVAAAGIYLAYTIYA